MDDERLALTAEFRDERRVTLEELRGHEIAVMNEFKVMSEQTMQDFDSRGRGLINFFFLRALELTLLVLILCTIVLWIALRLHAKSADRSGGSVDPRARRAS